MMTPWSFYRSLSAADAFRIPSTLEVGIVTLFPGTKSTEWGMFLRDRETLMHYPLCFLPDNQPELGWAIHYVLDSYVLSVPEDMKQDLNGQGRKQLFPETEVSKWDRDKLWLPVPKSWADYWMPRFEPQWEAAYSHYEKLFRHLNDPMRELHQEVARQTSMRNALATNPKLVELQERGYKISLMNPRKWDEENWWLTFKPSDAVEAYDIHVISPTEEFLSTKQVEQLLSEVKIGS